MDDFFVYYDNSNNDGIIKAISPKLLSGMNNMDHIRIPDELGKEFLMGNKSLSNWKVEWDAVERKMTLQKEQQHDLYKKELLIQIPIKQKTDDPDLTIIWNRVDNKFTVIAKNKMMIYRRTKLWFFVTQKDEYHIPVFIFDVYYGQCIDHPMIISCDINLPKTFSVFTMKLFDSYGLDIIDD